MRDIVGQDMMLMWWLVCQVKPHTAKCRRRKTFPVCHSFTLCPCSHSSSIPKHSQTMPSNTFLVFKLKNGVHLASKKIYIVSGWILVNMPNKNFFKKALLWKYPISVTWRVWDILCTLSLYCLCFSILFLLFTLKFLHCMFICWQYLLFKKMSRMFELSKISLINHKLCLGSAVLTQAVLSNEEK